MKTMRVKFFVLAFLFLFSWGTIGMAADFPQKPIRMIIPYSAGGGADIMCRAFQPSLEKVLGQRILIDNIGAGTTKVGTMELMKSKPDGYTLIFSTTESWVGYYYSKTFDYKAWEMMTPIANVTSESMGFFEVRAESPYKTWADLVRLAKENPGKLTCGGAGAGGMTELIMDEVTKAAGIKTRYVPFAGAGPAKVALLGGHIDFRINTPAVSIDMIRAGKTRGLAVSDEKRMETLPDVPTFKELGIEVPTYSLSRAIWGPPKIPANLLNTITKMVEKATQDPSFIKIAQEQFISTVDYQPPDKMKARVDNFNKQFGKKLEEMYK